VGLPGAVALVEWRRAQGSSLRSIRRSVGAEALIGADTVRLLPGLITVDLGELRAAVASGDIDGALAVWGGEPFAGLSIPGERGWAA